MTAISLPCDLQAWAEAEVAAGRAQSVERLMVDSLEARRRDVEWVRGRLDEARADIANGRVLDGHEVLAELDRWIAEDSAAAA
jgi:predicted transcriptional regulator